MSSHKYDQTTGPVGRTLIAFALPYLLASFMQTFYGLMDLFVIGQFNGSASTSAVAIGSQIMHMFTLVIAGFAMGTTVRIGRSVGAKKPEEAAKTVGSSFWFFLVFGVVLTVGLYLLTNSIVSVMMTPKDAVMEARSYLSICFLGAPFIIAFNVIASIFRGAGDSRSPMIFVGISCVLNIGLDFLFVGAFDQHAAGAALATVISQAVSVLVGLLWLLKRQVGFAITRADMGASRAVIGDILKVGTPIAIQEGAIQISFILITIIANSRGLTVSTAVGVVEKIITFLFLVPSAFLSAISALTAQNMGAEKPERARATLRLGIIITVVWGIICMVYNQFLPETLVGLFTKEKDVLLAGCEYIRAYSFDVIFAGIHFCFSGYFSGNQKSIYSFIHNIIAILAMRIPGAYLASIWFPKSLYPMGVAIPLGSLLSAIICAFLYRGLRKKERSIKNV